ncbi:MAG: RNA 2',3'-cyclic phosphodiesterase [Acidobacteriota bacterium]|nr:RNA 2',3'-cyclic phosphodiesterase [Blastocatellia bacterium]MDW8412177.1 RNA 2',3'-cyclic phosphodiesterase [Acidobacteriota bacterium]
MRAFVAIDLPDELKQRLSGLRQLLDRGEPLAWIKPTGFHLTLHFLGEIEKTDIERVSNCMRVAAAGLGSFELVMAGLNAFPNLRAPKVVWAGVQDPTGKLDKLQKKLQGELESKGFRRENNFVPHVTIARVKGSPVRATVKAIKSTKLEESVFWVNEIVLMQSKLEPGGSVYSRLVPVNLS